MIEQKILTASEDYHELDSLFISEGVNKLFLVCDNSFPYLQISQYFERLEERLGIECIKFSDFKPNPVYSSVKKGVIAFNKQKADIIVAIGGGSAIDVAKCIKLYANMDGTKNYLKQEIRPNTIKLMAIPTTAGTGSEATRYSVIYYKNIKQSISDKSIIPSIVLYDSSVLKTLPLYQKKSTMMDALCHAIESFWSVNSTEESKNYSKKAIQLILANMYDYLANEDAANSAMMKAAYLAGKAINITQTTAGHAMCYKLTSLYQYAHGHSAALCIAKLWPWMIENTDKCIDPRGREYLENTLKEMADVMGYKDAKSAAEKFQNIVNNLELPHKKAKKNDYLKLKSSVNPVRLKNHPIALDLETINYLYHQILK